MTTTPYAKTTMKIDGAPAVSGGQLVSGGNVIQLLGESTVNWIDHVWQIYEYPSGFALPTGWTNNNGIYECTLVVPPPFTVDPRTARWGKYLIRLIVNNGLLAGVYAGPGSVQPLVDVSSAVETKSPNLGLTDVAFQETNQFDQVRQWIGELKATLRVLDTAVGAGVATPPGGTNGQVQYNAGGSFGGLPVLKWDSVSSRVVASSGGLEVSNPGGTFGYSIVGGALAADRILTLPLLTANDTVVTEAFIQTLTNKTLVAANNTITDTGAALGDLFYFNGTRFVRLARGSVGQVLTSTSTTVAWQTFASSSTITSANFYINTATGNDSNDGLTSGTALATLEELLRRWGQFPILRPVGGTMNVWVSGDLNPATVQGFRGMDCNGCQILFQGMPTTVRSGTITALTALNQSANQGWEITDAGMPGVWSTDETRRIRITSGPRAGAIAWVGKDLGSHTARVSRFAHQAFYGDSPTYDAPQVGDPYVVEHLPTINIGLINPYGEYNPNVTSSMYFIDFDCVAPPYVYATSVDVEFINSRLYGVWGFDASQLYIENCCLTAKTSTDYMAYLSNVNGGIEAGLLHSMAPATDPTFNLQVGHMAVNGLTSQNMMTFGVFDGAVVAVSDLGIFDATLQFPGDGSFVVGANSNVTCAFSGGDSIYGSGNAKGLFSIDVGGTVNLAQVPAITFAGGDFAFYPTLSDGRPWSKTTGQYGQAVANTWANLTTYGSLHDPEVQSTILLAGSSGSSFLPYTGTTGSRPASPYVGMMYFDTTLGKAVWWDGASWVGASSSGLVPRRSSAVTTTLVSGTDYHLSMTAPGQIAKLPTSPANGETFRVKAAYTAVGNTTIEALSGPNTVEGAASFDIGPMSSATLCFNADTSNWEDC